MTTNQEALFNIATTIYDLFQNAKENLNHSTDSHETSYGAGQCEMMETVIGYVYDFIKETDDGDSIMNDIKSYEKGREEFVRKAEIIIEASDYELSLESEDDECLINEVIENLEKDRIEVTTENLDKIVEYIERQIGN